MEESHHKCSRSCLSLAGQFYSPITHKDHSSDLMTFELQRGRHSRLASMQQFGATNIPERQISSCIDMAFLRIAFALQYRQLEGAESLVLTLANACLLIGILQEDSCRYCQRPVPSFGFCREFWPGAPGMLYGVFGILAGGFRKLLR